MNARGIDISRNGVYGVAGTGGDVSPTHKSRSEVSRCDIR
jgi:hypothetical protein